MILILLMLAPASQARTWRVPAEVPTIQAGIDSAAAQDTVLVAPGTYSGPGNWDIIWGGKDLVLCSEAGAEATILDGGSPPGTLPCSPTVAHRAFRLHDGLTRRSVIDGFTMQGFMPGSQGGALMCESASVRITRCNFIGNGSCVAGGAIALFNSFPAISYSNFSGNRAGDQDFPDSFGGGIWGDAGSSPTISLSSFSLNKAGGIDYEYPPVGLRGEGGAIYAYSATIIGCDFSRNSTYFGGGAVSLTGESSSLVRDCTFFANGSREQAGALKCGGETTIEDCVFRENALVVFYQATSGGAVWSSGSTVMRDCLLQGNYGAYFGGGVCASDSLTITGCIFARNSVDPYMSNGGGAGLFLQTESYLQMRNCTFWRNANSGTTGGVVDLGSGGVLLENCIIAESIFAPAVTCPGSTSLSCCDLYGNQLGDWVDCVAGQLGVNGNIAEDPLFCGPEAGDFTVDAASPCVTDPACGLIGALGVGCSGFRTEVPEGVAAHPGEFYLGASTPNPARGRAEIVYSIPSEGRSAATLAIYDARGRRIRTLADGPQSPGAHSVAWDGRDEAGSEVAAGVYFYELRWNGRQETRRMILAR